MPATHTIKFGKNGMVITHPSGVKVSNTKAEVQAWMDTITAERARLLADRTAIQTDYMDKINSASRKVTLTVANP